MLGEQGFRSPMKTLLQKRISIIPEVDSPAIDARER